MRSRLAFVGVVALAGAALGGLAQLGGSAWLAALVGLSAMLVAVAQQTLP